MLTLEKVLAAVLTYPQVANRLREVVTSDLAIPNPLYRRIAEFVVAFVEEHETLPKPGDYTVWANTLEEPTRGGVLTALAEIQRQDISGYTPEYLAETAVSELQIVAARTAVARLGSLGAEASPEALALVADRVRALGESAAGAQRFRLLSDSELEEQPQPEYLIDGILPSRSFTVLYGAPACGKTFLALDWSLCIATGNLWLANATRQGPVVYVAAEGGGGLPKRLRAWKQYRGIDGEAGVLFLTEPINLRSPREVSRFLTAIKERSERPALVVIDTLSRCMPGGDENSQKDMGEFVAGVDRIRSELGAAVLVIHHTRREADRERGSTVLPGAADLMVSMKDDSGIMTVKPAKQRDSEPFEPINLALSRVEQSCVLVPADSVPDLELPEPLKAALKALDECAGDSGARAKDWERACGCAERTFHYHRDKLLSRGLVSKQRAGRETRYTATDRGRAVITAIALQTNCNRSDSEVTASCDALSTSQLAARSTQPVAGPDEDDVWEHLPGAAW